MVDKYDNYELQKVTSLENVPGTIKDGDGYIWDPSGLPDKDFDDSKVPLEFRRLAIWMRSKLFGKDVRETVARLAEMSGLLNVRQETVESFIVDFVQSVTEAEMNSGPEIVQMRDGERTANARLERDYNEVTGQLVQKVGGGKLATMGDLDQDVKTAMTGGSVAVVGENTVVEKNIVDGQVTPRKTSFFKFSTNLANPETESKNKELTSSGTLRDNIDYNSTDFISVKPNTQYRTEAFNYAVHYNASKVRVHNHDIIGNTLTTPATAAYVRLSYPNWSAAMPTRRLNEGSTLLPFEPYYIHIPKGHIEPDGPTEGGVGELGGLVDISTNLYNPVNESFDVEINASTGGLVQSEWYFTSDFVEIKPSTPYSVESFNAVGYYDEDKQFLEKRDIVGKKFTTTNKTKYVKLSFADWATNRKQRRLNEGDVLLPYEPYYVRFKEGVYTSSELNLKKDYVFPPEHIGNDVVLKDTPREGMSLTQLYSAWDVLIAEYPEYISKTILGKDQSGQYDVWRIDLHEPEYSPTNWFGEPNYLNKKPKIAMTCSVHGGENIPALATYYFVKAMLEDWKDDTNLEYLRFNIDFSFIVVGNPWGYVNNNYKNSRGVNIKRNLPYNHNPSTGFNDPTYGGTSPLSEVETVYHKNFIDEMKEDAIFYADMHGFSSHQADVTPGVSTQFYFATEHHIAYPFNFKHVIEKNTRIINKNYTVETDNFLGFVEHRDTQTTSDGYASSIGLPAMMFELCPNTMNDTAYYTDEALKMATEIQINSFLMFLQQLKDKPA